MNYIATIALKSKSGETYIMKRPGEMKGVSAGVATYEWESLDPPPSFEDVPQICDGKVKGLSATTISEVERNSLRHLGITVPKREVLGVGDLPPNTTHSVAPEASEEAPPGIAKE